MQRLVYIFVYPFIYLFASIPFGLLYIVSDFLRFFIYNFLGYRKNIVRQNIKLAFKGISNKKLRQIEKKFYTHFCDITLEALKSLKMSEKEMKERFVFKNIEVLKQFEEKKQSIIIIMGHYSSWEWMLSLGYYMSFKGYGIYTPLMNKYLNQAEDVGITKYINTFNNIARPFMATLDLSSVGIQGLLAAGVHPIRAARYMTYAMASLFNPKIWDRFVVDNADEIDDFIRGGGYWSDLDDAGDFMFTKGVTSLPAIGKLAKMLSLLMSQDKKQES